jgi:hypothetical protein
VIGVNYVPSPTKVARPAGCDIRGCRVAYGEVMSFPEVGRYCPEHARHVFPRGHWASLGIEKAQPVRRGDSK